MLFRSIDKNETEKKGVHCSFCGKFPNEVYRLIAGPDVWICNECVDLCNIILADEKAEMPALERPLAPKSIGSGGSRALASQAV